MTTLQDKFGIINKNQIKGSISDIVTFIENSLNDNIIFHPVLINDIINSVNNEELLFKIKNIIDVYNRNTRNNIRRMIKKDNYDSKKLNDQLFNFITILRKINSYLYKSDMSYNKYDSQYKWGTSEITKIGIYSIIEIIFKDKIMDNILMQSIKNNSNMYMLFRNLSNLDVYKPINKDITNKVEFFISKIINDNKCNINNYNVNTIHNFKYLIDNYSRYKKQFNYIKDSTFMSNIEDNIKETLKCIVISFDIDGLIRFITEYKDKLLLIMNIDFVPYLTYSILNLKIDNGNILYNDNPVTIYQIVNLLECINIFSKEKMISDIIFSNGFSELLKDEKTIINIVNIISNNISTQKPNNMYLSLSKYITNKDIFYKFMELKLIERFVYFYKSSNMEMFYSIEENIAKELSSYHSKSNLCKYYTILDDIKNSNYNNSLYIMTEKMWDINIGNSCSVVSNVNGLFSENCSSFNQIYKLDQGVNKELLYHLDIGYVDITISNDKGRTSVRMLPIQVLCFELFSNSKTYEKQDLFNSLKNICQNYSDKMIENTIQSLVDSNLVTVNNNTYSENKNFNINGYNFINTFKFVNNNKQKLYTKMMNDLVFTRMEIINTHINSSLKLNKYMTKEQLFETCRDNIKLFVVENEIFNKSIMAMQDKDYIQMNESGEYMKLLY